MQTPTQQQLGMGLDQVYPEFLSILEVTTDSRSLGFYGRLDQDEWFHTTVTNVEPTAKQSWVLHPWVSEQEPYADSITDTCTSVRGWSL